MTQAPIGSDISYGLSRRSTVIVLLFGISLLLAGICGGTVLTRHEVLAAQPAREMLLFREWIIPHFVGEPRLVKPPTMGWCVALAMAITGSMADWVPRAPAAVAGVVVGYAIARVGARFFGDAVGLLAGLVQLSSVYLLMQARLAESDMPLAACVTVAMATFAAGNLDGPGERSKSRWLPALFYFSIGLGCLFKGPVAILFTLPACGAFAAATRDRRALRFLLNPPGLIVFLVVAASWYVVAAKVYPPIVDVWRAEVQNRTQGQGDLTGGVQPWHFYVWNVLWLALPWTPLALIGWGALWKGPRFSSIGGFLTVWLAAGIFLMSLSAWKHKHYIIPALPAMSIPAAVGMLAWLRYQHARPLVRWHYLLTMIVFGAGCTAGIVAVLAKVNQGPTPTAAVIGIVLCGGVAVLYLEYRRRRTAQIVAIFLTTWCAVLATMLGVMRHHDAYRPSAELGRLAGRTVPDGKTIYLLGLREAHVAYYTRFPMERIDNPLQAPDRLVNADDPIFVLTRATIADKLAVIGDVRVIARSTRVSRANEDEDLLTFVRVDRNGTRGISDESSSQAHRASAVRRDRHSAE